MKRKIPTLQEMIVGEQLNEASKKDYEALTEEIVVSALREIVAQETEKTEGLSDNLRRRFTAALLSYHSLRYRNPNKDKKHWKNQRRDKSVQRFLKKSLQSKKRQRCINKLKQL